MGLLLCLPRYTGLVAAPRPGSSAPALWLADAVLATRVQFLMAMLGACAAGLPPSKAEATALPVALLYCVHTAPPIASAAQTLFCALFPHLRQVQPYVLLPLS